MVVLILISVFSMLLCGYIASKRHVSVLKWLFFGLLFGPFAIPFALFSKNENAIKNDKAE